MLHSSRGRRAPLQHHPALPLLVDGVLQLRAEASRSGALPRRHPGPKGAAVARQCVRHGGRRRRAALRTAERGGRVLPELFLSGPSDVRRARRGRVLPGRKAEIPRCANQVRE